MTELSVVMPAFNEAGYLSGAVEVLIAALRASGPTFEVLVIENGSTDGTWAEAQHLAGIYPELHAVHLPEADYGAALREGVRLAGGARVVNFDVDLVNVSFLADATVKMDSTGAAIVVGSKRSAGASDRRSVPRRAATWAYASVLRAAFGMKVSDTHGVKLLNRAAVAPLAGMCLCTKDLFDTELVLRAERAGLVVAEVPVETVESRPPRTRFASRVPRTVAGLVKLRFAMARRPKPSLTAAPSLPRTVP